MNLDEIKARVEAASPPPWRTGEGNTWEAASAIYIGPVREFEAGQRVALFYTANPRPASDEFSEQDRANARFVAHARQDVLNLIAEVERLDEELRQLREAVQPLVEYLEVIEERYSRPYMDHPLNDAAYVPGDITRHLCVGDLRRIAGLASEE